jgi:hypothetical protein
MQKLAEGHETAARALLASISAGAESEVPFQVIALPSMFTAMQKLADGHETACAPPDVVPATSW